MKRLRYFACALVLALGLTLTQNNAHAAASAFIVTKTADAPDANPGDGKCKSLLFSLSPADIMSR